MLKLDVDIVNYFRS